ncbi:MAG: RusA family crossover junction endodeoxyribonuclease [Caulobacteraceae bacterium]|nr:RusA family crossover junction endodeoxyribonuclease [Caulobacteraceae bacterium]
MRLWEVDVADEDTFERALEMEAAGAAAGLNPMFGEWTHAFKFAPVPYGNGAAKRGDFRNAIQSELKNRWLFSAEIHLEIVLHVDVQTTLETDETADLDNYAKAILDGLKGADGIVIDDTQVQSLCISWVDGYREPYFVVTAKASPDDFVLKPQEFYEMPDGLWYPHGRAVWDEGRAVDLSDRDHFAGLSILELMSSTKKRARAEMRKTGVDRLRAYQRSKYVSTSARGFHRSRLENGGFKMHPLKEWQSDRRDWNEKNPRISLDHILNGLRGPFDKMIDLLAGKLPGKS